jgi:hypothetical protein
MLSESFVGVMIEASLRCSAADCFGSSRYVSMLVGPGWYDADSAESTHTDNTSRFPAVPQPNVTFTVDKGIPQLRGRPVFVSILGNTIGLQ